MTDYYDKTETDALLADKADVSDLPDMTDYYDKTETDALLADKADVSDLPDMTDYYDKTETDALLANKANVSDIPTVNNGQLTIQKNGVTVTTFSANQSGNATANISCENKISWNTSGNWHYYTDSAGVKHLYYRGTNISRNYNGTIGGWHYVTTGETINFPVQLSNIYSISGSIVHNGDLCGFSVQTYGSNSITLWLYSAGTGTKSISICLDIVST